ncbi:MAG: hypothetical protein COA79_18710 [Planctomycetota bacterium]|nr:MAG: hypothetical protein COA79_18710 [Planctomycetota bacterium]
MNSSKSFDYEKIPDGYYDEIFHKKSGLQSAWHNLKFKMVSHKLKGLGKHLDLGCGPGTFIGNFQKFSSGVGIDLSQSQIEFARKKYGIQDNISFESCADGKIHFKEESFEQASMIEVIEHLDVDKSNQLLLEIFRVLKPSGQIVVTTPNYGSLWPVLEILVNKTSKVSYEEQHIQKFKRKQLKLSLETAGYIKVKVKSFLFFAPFLAMLSWGLSKGFFKFENSIGLNPIGFLLIATGEKPSG